MDISPLTDTARIELNHRFRIISGSEPGQNQPTKGIPSAGLGVVDIFAIIGSIATVTQVILMTIDMWVKNSKKKAGNKYIGKPDRAWDEVKAIRIQMSDGTWMEFESWFYDPEKIKSFVTAFNTSSQTPKPLRVVFQLKNGKKAQIDVSESTANEQQLDQFIKYLKL